MKGKLVGLFYFFFRPIRQVYFRWAKPITAGVRAIILNQEGQVLLVRHSYGRGWFLPGGGVAKRESFLVALKRELREELGLVDCRIEGLLGAYTNLYEGKTDHIAVFIISDPSPIQPDNLEVAEHGFFDCTALPEDISPGSRKRILEYTKQKVIDYRW